MSRLPLHPVLVALAPVLSMYAAGVHAADLSELAAAAAIAAAAGAGLLLVCAVVYRDLDKAALVATILLTTFIVVGEMYSTWETYEILGVRPARRRIFLPASYAVLAGVAFLVYRSRRSFGRATALANVVALGVLIAPAWQIAAAQPAIARARAMRPELAPVVAPASDRRTPDVYYVIFDRYGDEATLRELGVDNRPLFEYLEGKGFFVARDSRSNYIKTVLSLASSLNMTYLDDLAATYGDTSSDWLPIFDRVRHHRVGQFLTSRGYTYYHVGSWYAPTRSNPHAATNINYFTAVPKPVMELLSNPLLEPVQHVASTPLLDYRRQHFERTTREVDDVLTIAARPGPKFVFVHLLIPHQPYVFDRDGRYVPIEVENRRAREQNIANQVQAANLLIRKLVEGVLAASPNHPVIIVQGDEGPYPPGTEGEAYSWTQASADLLRQRSGILNAYLLPDGGRARLYSTVSPVNSFRIVLNHYFGAQLPLLPDRTIRHASGHQPYAFDDVTEMVRRNRPAASTLAAAR